MHLKTLIKVALGLFCSVILTAQTFRLANPARSDPKASGWDVDNGMGRLRLSLPVGQVPGEIPIPVALTMDGTFKAYGMWLAKNNAYYKQQSNLPIFATCSFGYVGYRSGPNIADLGRYLALENGDTYALSEFSGKSQGSGLLAAYGFTNPPSYGVNSSGTVLWATETLSPASLLPFPWGNLVKSNLPVGYSLTITSQVDGPKVRYDIVADKNIIRIFADLGDTSEALPVLWADRFGHYVTFKWTRVSSGLPSGISSIVRVDAVNQRGQGVTVRYTNWADTTVIHDLMRIDFTQLSAPAALVQGYSGGAQAAPTGFPGWASSAFPAWTITNSMGGMMGRPTTVTMGDPLTVAQPSWNNTGAPAGTQAALPSSNSGVASRVWTFNYDANLAELRSMTDPMSVTTAFSYGNFNLNHSTSDNDPLMYRGVTETVETDNSPQPAPAVRTRTWNRTLPLPGYAWTVVCQDYWSSVAASDSSTTYTYSPLSSPLDYSNGFLLSAVLSNNADGKAWSTTTYTSTTSSEKGGGLDSSLSLPASITLTRDSENLVSRQFTYTDSSALQASTITSQVGVGGTPKTFQIQGFQYNDKWAILESGQIKQILTTRYNPASGAALSPTSTILNTWDSGTALQLQQSCQSASATLLHGQSLTYGSTSGTAAYGKVVTQAVLHNENSTTASPVPATVAVGYDSSTGQANSWTTSYQDVPSGTGTVSKKVTAFDGANRATNLTDEKEVQTGLAYDLYSRVTNSCTQGTAAVSTTYPSLWEVVQNQAGLQKTSYFDGFGRLTSESLPDGTSLSYAYDVHGRPSVTTKTCKGAGVSAASTTHYDLLGRPVSRKGFDGITVTFTYSAAADGNNQATQSYGGTYPVVVLTDPFGQVIQRNLPTGDIAHSAYDGLGHVTSTQVISAADASSQVGTFTYDALGRPTSKTEPETGTRTFTDYNALNQAQTLTESGSRVRKSTFDGLGRLRSVSATSSSGTVTENFKYAAALLTDSSNTATGVSSATVTQHFDYWPAASGAFLLDETTTQTGVTNPSTITYGQYSNLGAVQSITYPSGRTVTYGFDGIGRPTSVATTLNGTSQYLVPPPASSPFDVWGNRSTLTFQSGALDNWAPDATHVRPGTAKVIPKTGNSTGWTYSYETITGRLRDTGEWTLQNDSLGRLRQAQQNMTLVGGLLTETLDFDAFSNNMSLSPSETVGAVPSTVNSFNLNMNGNKLPIQTNSNGNINASYLYGELQTVATSVSSNKYLDFQWDAMGRLALVTQSDTGASDRYVYAPSGLRVGRLNSVLAEQDRTYAYTSGGRLMSVYLSGPKWGESWQSDLIYMDGRAIAEIDGNGVHELHLDHLGTPRVVTNGLSGAIEATQTYGPYGEYLCGSGNAPLTGYTGHLQTEPNGLIYMKGRFYSAAWHCFLNPDQGADPKQWSQYAYAGGNPLVNTDSSGMSWLSNLLGDVTHGVHRFGHAMAVNWDDGGRGVTETVAIAVASYYTGGLVNGWCGGGFSGAVAGGAAGGAVAGGAMTGSLRGAEMGAMSGALFAGVNQGCQHLGMGTFGKGLTNSVVAGAYSQANGGCFSKGFFAEAESFSASAAFQGLVGSPANPMPATDRTTGIDGDNVYVEENGIIPQEWRDNNYNVFGLNQSTGWNSQSSTFSNIMAAIPGMNAIAQFHDTMFLSGGLGVPFNNFTNYPCMAPAALISYGAIKNQLGYGVH